MWDFIKFKNFSSEKDSDKRMERQARDWENVLQKTHLVRCIYAKYTKNFKRFFIY